MATVNTVDVMKSQYNDKRDTMFNDYDILIDRLRTLEDRLVPVMSAIPQEQDKEPWDFNGLSEVSSNCAAMSYRLQDARDMVNRIIDNLSI